LFFDILNVVEVLKAVKEVARMEQKIKHSQEKHYPERIKNSMIFVLLECGYSISEAEKIAGDVNNYYLKKNSNTPAAHNQEVA
jgi:hypothetical protein